MRTSRISKRIFLSCCLGLLASQLCGCFTFGEVHREKLDRTEEVSESTHVMRLIAASTNRTATTSGNDFTAKRFDISLCIEIGQRETRDRRRFNLVRTLVVNDSLSVAPRTQGLRLNSSTIRVSSEEQECRSLDVPLEIQRVSSRSDLNSLTTDKGLMFTFADGDESFQHIGFLSPVLLKDGYRYVVLSDRYQLVWYKSDTNAGKVALAVVGDVVTLPFQAITCFFFLVQRNPRFCLDPPPFHP